MTTTRRGIDRLCRLARLHESVARSAAQRVAEAQHTHGQLQALGERSGTIAAAYGARGDAQCGAELTRQLGFIHGLARIQTETESERLRAEAESEEAVRNLRQAERRQEVTGDKLKASRRAAQAEEEIRDSAMFAGRNPGLARKLKD